MPMNLATDEAHGPLIQPMEDKAVNYIYVQVMIAHNYPQPAPHHFAAPNVHDHPGRHYQLSSYKSVKRINTVNLSNPRYNWVKHVKAIQDWLGEPFNMKGTLIDVVLGGSGRQKDIKGFGICSSSDKGSDDGLILIVPLSMSYFSEDVRDGAGTIGV
ncbi:hypothetical protein [Absidia glauca]|uniref:Uncharacterized protein n=1 Tax=Absidia glauca TaxID=4829 RepID=A0A163K3C9_ABSGL|nr:hypothetical protein [Absidia glauca]